MCSSREHSGDTVVDCVRAHTFVPVEMRPGSDGSGVADGAGTAVPVKQMVWTVAACVLLASLIVLMVIGHHASRLGDVPLSMDPERAQEDIWAGARSHYARITFVAVLTVLGSWLGLLLTWPDPRCVRPHSRGRARWRMALLIGLGIALGSALAFAPNALSISRPMFVGAVLVSLTAAVGMAILALGGAAESGTRQALAGAMVVIPALTLAPARVVVSLAHQAFPDLPWLVIVSLGVYIAWLAFGVPMSIATMRRWWEMLRPSAATPVPVAGAARREPDSERRRSSPVRRALTAAIVLAIGAGALWAARPVSAPSAQTVPPLLHPVPPEPVTAAPPWPGDAGDIGALREGEPDLVLGDIDGCRPDELDIVALGDGVEYAVLVATNTGRAPCALTGHVSVRLTQGGIPIELRPVPSYDSPTDAAGLGAVLDPGGHAHAELRWPGYGAAADQDTPQRLYVMVDPVGESEAEVRLRIPSGGDGYASGAGPAPLPAPFDLAAGIDGGAEIRTGVWTPGP